MKKKMTKLLRLSRNHNPLIFQGVVYTTGLTLKHTSVTSATNRDSQQSNLQSINVLTKLQQILMFHCKRQPSCTQRSFRIPETNKETVFGAWSLIYDMLCIDVQHTDLRTPTAVDSHLEKLFKGIDSRVYKGTHNGYPSSRFAESGGHVDFNGMIDFERECTKDTTRPGIHYEYSPRDRFTFHSCVCCRRKKFLE